MRVFLKAWTFFVLCSLLFTAFLLSVFSDEIRVAGEVKVQYLEIRHMLADSNHQRELLQEDNHRLKDQFLSDVKAFRQHNSYLVRMVNARLRNFQMRNEDIKNQIAVLVETTRKNNRAYANFVTRKMKYLGSQQDHQSDLMRRFDAELGSVPEIQLSRQRSDIQEIRSELENTKRSGREN